MRRVAVQTLGMLEAAALAEHADDSAFPRHRDRKSTTHYCVLTRHSDGAPTEHRMTDTMAPGASSDCTKAYPIASDAPTTSPSHGNTSSVHGESPRPIPEKRYVLSHPRLHLPICLYAQYG